MPWYRSDDGQTVFHACIRGAKPEACRAPRLEGDNAAHGEQCGRSGAKLCDGPLGPYSELGADLDYCPEHAHLAQPVEAKVERHRWVKLRLHVYICRKCGTGKVNSQRAGEWITTFHCPEGTSITSAHVPPCAVGPFTKKYLAAYSDAIDVATAEPEAPQP
jgi:hypothetical protein